MQKDNLIKILQDNGVSFNKALLNEGVAGYSNDENAVYAQRLYGDLFLMAQYGVQNGFSKVSGEIKNISNLIAKLLNGSKYEIVNLTKMEAQRQKILADLGDLNRGINMGMKDELMHNLEDCIAVSDAITSFRSDNENLCNKIAESKKILLQIKDELDNVSDVLSQDAAKYQAAVFDILMDWRRDVSQYNCYTDSIQSLKQAVLQVKEWSKLTSTISRFSRAKEKKDYYLYSPDYDDVCGIIKAAPYAERTDGLKTAVAAYRESTALLCNVDKKKAELEELEKTFSAEKESLNARLKQLSDANEAVIIAYQNGEMDATTADGKCSAYEEEYARCEDNLQEIESDYSYRISELRQEVYEAGSDSRIREGLAREYESFINMLENYRNTDPAKFVLLCSRIDFNTMHDTLSGRADAESRSKLFTNIQAITSVVEQEINEQRKTAAILEDIRRKEKQESREQLIKDKERDIQRQKQQTATVSKVGRINSAKNSEEVSAKNMAARLSSRRLGGIKPPADQNTNVNPDGTIPVDNDDK